MTIKTNAASCFIILQPFPLQVPVASKCFFDRILLTKSSIEIRTLVDVVCPNNCKEFAEELYRYLGRH